MTFGIPAVFSSEVSRLSKMYELLLSENTFFRRVHSDIFNCISFFPGGMVEYTMQYDCESKCFIFKRVFGCTMMLRNIADNFERSIHHNYIYMYKQSITLPLDAADPATYMDMDEIDLSNPYIMCSIINDKIIYNIPLKNDLWKTFDFLRMAYNTNIYIERPFILWTIFKLLQSYSSCHMETKHQKYLSDELCRTINPVSSDVWWVEADLLKRIERQLQH